MHWLNSKSLNSPVSLMKKESPRVTHERTDVYGSIIAEVDDFYLQLQSYFN